MHDLIRTVALLIVTLTPVACTKKPEVCLLPGGICTFGKVLENTGEPTLPDVLDISTAEERRAATVRLSEVKYKQIGETIASLGNPAETGFWLKTGLVAEVVEGKLVDKASGNYVRVTLVPLVHQENSSQISLSAMRALGLSLEELHQLKVFTNELNKPLT